MIRSTGPSTTGGFSRSLLAGIRHLGHASFRITGSRTIYIDPWRIGPPPHERPDLVLITHPHRDHCSPSDLARLPGFHSAAVVTVADAARKLARPCRVIAPGDRTTAAGLRIEAVPAYNKEKPYHPRANRWVGFLVEMDGRIVYHAGDTDRIPEMARIECDVALLPVGGRFGMDPAEAALAAGEIETRLAVPMHAAGDDRAARRFVALSPVPAAILSGNGRNI